MGWLVLVKGAPDEPESWDDIASFPTPPDFFNELFMSVCHVDTRNGSMTEETTTPGDVRTARGFQGTQCVGFRWVEAECLESNKALVGEAARPVMSGRA